MDWFRMYSEFAHDPKVQSMPEAMQRRLMMLLCLRCSNALVTLHETEIAFALRITEEELAETKVLFLRKQFIDDTWEIMNWDKRQFVSDSSAPRVARHRAKLKAEAEAEAKQPRNVTVTPQNRTDTEQIQKQKDPAEQPETARTVTSVDLSIAMRKNGVQSQPADPRLIAMAGQGVTPETIEAACAEAKRSKPDEQIGFGYVAKIIERWAKEADALQVSGAAPPAKSAGAWWATDATVMAKGAELGMAPNAGEQMQAFKGRIQAAIDNNGTAPPPPRSTVTALPAIEQGTKPEGLDLKGLVKHRASV